MNAKNSKMPAKSKSPLPENAEDRLANFLRMIDSAIEGGAQLGSSGREYFGDIWRETWESQKAKNFAAKAKPEDWLRVAFWATNLGLTNFLTTMASCDGLRSLFAGLDERQVGGEPLLCRIANFPNAETMEALIALGCDPKAVDFDGETALQKLSKAVTRDKKRMLECALILAPISDVNAVNAKGETALMSATQCRDANMVKFLAPLSNTNLQDLEGQTALHIAAVSDKEITAFLATCTDVRLKDKNEKTALDLVIEAQAWSRADVLMARLPAREATAALRKINEKLFPSTVPHVEAVALEDAVGLGVAVSGDRIGAKGDAGGSKSNKMPKTRRM